MVISERNKVRVEKTVLYEIQVRTDKNGEF